MAGCARGRPARPVILTLSAAKRKDLKLRIPLKRSFAGFAAQDERISQTGLEGCRPTARPGSASGSFPPSIEQAIDGGRWLPSSRPADALAPAPGSYPRPAHRELAESQCAAGDLPLRPA